MPNGNATEMREALVKCRDLAETIWLSEGGEDVSAEIAELKDTIHAALAKPPRNCDVGTAEEQAARYMNFCRNYPKCTGCPCVGRMLYHQCEFAWAHMAYERGA